jgi:RNase H-fold protein (predicted Holliday junction resolvase)
LRLLSQHTRKHRRSKPHHDAMAAWILLDSYLGGGRV